MKKFETCKHAAIKEQYASCLKTALEADKLIEDILELLGFDLFRKTQVNVETLTEQEKYDYLVKVVGFLNEKLYKIESVQPSKIYSLSLNTL